MVVTALLNQLTIAQSVIFNEAIGAITATTQISAWSGWTNGTGLTFSNGGSINSADLRATNASTGYSGSSGTGNVFFTGTSGAYGFSIGNINAAAYSNLQLFFAYRKESASILPALSVSYSVDNGLNYTPISFTFNQLATAGTGWYAAPMISLPAGAQVNGLRLKWEKTGSQSVRIDDIKLMGTLPPVVNISGSPGSLNTTQGTPSIETSFVVSGSNLTNDLLVSAPSGFEVSSTAGSGHASTLSITPVAGAVSNTNIYIRLTGTSVGSYSGNIIASSTGASDASLAMPNSTVGSSVALDQTITFGLFDPVTYGDANLTLTATASSGLPVNYTSSNTSVAQISNGNTVVIVGAGTANIIASQPGNASYNPAPSVSRTLTVAPATLTLSSAAVTDKVYNGNAAAVVTGILNGVIGSDNVSLVGQGTFASVDVGNGIAVTDNSSLSGTDAGNYILTPTVGLTGNIVGGVQTITFNSIPQYSTATSTFNLNATTNATGATITYTSSNLSVATISGNVVTILGPGSAVITASSGAYGNYAAATSVDQTLSVINALLAWDFTGLNTVNTALPTYITSGLGASANSTLTRGSGAPASTGGNSFRTQGFQNNGIALTNTDYFQFTITPQIGTAVNLSSIDARFNGTSSFYASPGVTSQFAYSLDGVTFNLIGSPVTSTSLSMGQIDLTSITALQNVQPGSTITLRYYASGQTSSGGWGFSSSSSGVMGLIIGGTTTALPCPFYQDLDGDGFGNVSVSIDATCGSTQVGYVELVSTDCNDGDNLINPSATELPCNALDDNCNSSLDENYVAGCNDPSACNYSASATCSASCDYTQQTYYQDLDADGYGNNAVNQISCTIPFGYVLLGGDCDDANSGFNPGATDILCNNGDENCNGTIDDGAIVGCMDVNATNFDISANCPGNCTFSNFTPGNVLAIRLGNGTGSLSSAGTPVFVEEMNTTSVVSTIALPTTGPNRMVLNGSSTAEAQVTRSLDGTILVLPGYDAAVGTASINTTTGVVAPRVISTLGLNAGTFSRQLTSTSVFSGQNFRSAASDGTNFWGVGSGSGVNYFGPLTPAAVSTTSNNNRVINAYNGNLYFSTGSGTRGIYKVGTGLPTSSGVTATMEIATGGSSSPYAFQFNLDGNICYVADDNTTGAGGVQKYVKTNNVWSLVYTVSLGASSGARGLAVDFYSSATARVYAVKNDAAGTYVVYFDDNGTATPTINTVATALIASNKAYRSIAFAPCTPSTWYADADGDGYGALASTLSYCTQPYGYVSNSTDCDDVAAAANPGAVEICDGLDNDCNGAVDNGLTFQDYYTDADGDTYGTGAATNACSAPSGMVTNSADCNDSDGAINPLGTEICGNAIDEDCSGSDLVCPVSGIAAAVNVLNIGQFGTGVQNTQSVDLTLGTNTVESPGLGNDMWFSFVAQNNAIRISITGSSSVEDDNDLSVYSNPSTIGVQLVPLVSENDVHPNALGAASDGGNEILYFSNLVVNNTYFVLVRNNNATPGVCSLTISYLRGSQADIGPYTGGTGVYNNTCQNFKAAFRPNGTNYTVNRWLDNTASGVPVWTYVIPSNSTICQLGRVLPPNMSGAQVSYPVTVDVTYNLPDAFGNANVVVARGNVVTGVGLNSEASLTVRSTDVCPAFKSPTTGSVATNRSVCGVDVYEWQFTEANAGGIAIGLPNLNPIYGPSGASRILALSNVPGIAPAKFYNVRIRTRHIDGVSLSSWGNNACVKTIGAAGMAFENSEAVGQALSNGAEVVLFPNPSNGQGVNLHINGMEGDLQVRVTDANGRLVFTDRFSVEGALLTTLNFNQGLSSGLYQVELISGTSRNTLRMSVVR